MNPLWGSLFKSTGAAGAADALVDGHIVLSREALLARAAALSEELRATGTRSIGLYADNGVDWVVVDLACQLAEICLTPIPRFFSPAQVAHALQTSQAELLFFQRPLPDQVTASLAVTPRAEFVSVELCCVQLSPAPARSVALPANCGKVTFTSGTTGAPKGVCLSTAQQMTVARSLADAVALENPRHLCVLPLSTLLENVGGVYAPLLCQGTVLAPPLEQLGLSGSTGLRLPQLLASISRWQPNSMILVPELLNALVSGCRQGWLPPSSLRFVAVGGSRVAPELLSAARGAGLPAFEGYGMSECASVVCVNTPGADRPGTVGQPLPHVKLRVSNGEIHVSGNTFLGYAGQPDTWGERELATGDLGHINADGAVVVSGRRRNLIITSFGRNVSPEWVESELCSGPLLGQAAVFGEARPHCVALLVPGSASVSRDQVDAHVQAVNRRLPDYARVHRWQVLDRPFGVTDATATENGRLRRSVIFEKFRGVIDSLYHVPAEVSCS